MSVTRKVTLIGKKLLLHGEELPFAFKITTFSPFQSERSRKASRNAPYEVWKMMWLRQQSNPRLCILIILVKWFC